MRLIVGCEKSGIVRDEFARLGWDAWSCDLQPTERPGQHIQGDIRDHLDEDWNLLICHPDCTFLCSSGLHWNCRVKGRARKTRAAIEFAEFLWNANVPHIGLENPIGCLSSFSDLMRPHQTIQPYEFGHNASKGTCLWLKNLPKLRPTQYVEPRLVNGKQRWANQTDNGQNRLGPSPERAANRARTYEGIARAMAEQWTAFLVDKIGK